MFGRAPPSRADGGRVRIVRPGLTDMAVFVASRPRSSSTNANSMPRKHTATDGDGDGDGEEQHIGLGAGSATSAPEQPHCRRTGGTAVEESGCSGHNDAAERHSGPSGSICPVGEGEGRADQHLKPWAPLRRCAGPPLSKLGRLQPQVPRPLARGGAPRSTAAGSPCTSRLARAAALLSKARRGTFNLM